MKPSKKKSPVTGSDGKLVKFVCITLLFLTKELNFVIFYPVVVVLVLVLVVVDVLVDVLVVDVLVLVLVLVVVDVLVDENLNPNQLFPEYLNHAF